MRILRWLLLLPAAVVLVAVGIWIGHGGTHGTSPPGSPSGEAARRDLTSGEATVHDGETHPGRQPGTRPIVDALERYLKAKGSPMKGCGASFVGCADTFGVDPRLVVAISGAESGFGRRVCGEHNAWNWFHCYATGTCGADPCSHSPFPSWRLGGRTVAKFLKRSYLNKGYVTLELIAAKYCTQGCEHWLPNVKQFYAQDLGGNLNDLTWPVRRHKPVV